jgi:hypothetical protein
MKLRTEHRLVFFVFVRVSPSTADITVSQNGRSVPACIHPFRDSQKKKLREEFFTLRRPFSRYKCFKIPDNSSSECRIFLTATACFSVLLPP